MTPSKILRCSVTDAVALVTVLFIGFVMDIVFDIPPAMLLVQLLGVIVLSQAYPISTLKHDKRKHKPRHHIQVKIETPAFGIMAGLITYISYLLFFAYNALSPVFIDSTSELYQQATTVALVTLAFCLAINLFFIRADEHPRVLTSHIMNNKKLLTAFGLSFFLILNVVYNPWLQTVFSTEAIGVVEWAAAIFCAGIYSVLRHVQRYTRKHTRQSVVDMHKQTKTHAKHTS